MQSLAAAREQLIVLLRNRYRHTPHRVIVVFDGDAGQEQVSHVQRLCIIYSRQGESADAVLARLSAEAQRAGRAVEIYSDDMEVQQAVALRGGRAQTTEHLERQVYAAPRDVARRARYRAGIRRRYGLDAPYGKKEDEPPRTPRKKKRR
jgi:predicted RNA-binding protein with PIN domain